VKGGSVKLKLTEAKHHGPRRVACADAVTGKEISIPLQTLAVKESVNCAEPSSPRVRVASDSTLIDVWPRTELSNAGINP
jgi:hypothetical protein